MTVKFIPHKKQNYIRLFSCWHGGGRMDTETQRGCTALEGGNTTLSLLFLVALLSLVDEVLAASQHEVHHARKLVRGGGIGAGLVHAAAQAAVKGAERGVTV